MIIWGFAPVALIGLFLHIVVFRRKKQQWLLEELVMLRRKLDEANDEIKKTNGGIHTHYGKLFIRNL